VPHDSTRCTACSGVKRPARLYGNDSREYVPETDLPSKNDLVFLKSSTVGFTLEASLGSVIYFLPSM
jgi:hypothetical protein